ncbi:MAG: response regulator [Chloroflexi bacterium]|nr:MAG: response regulator [Chloroflexota bacterium]
MEEEGDGRGRAVQVLLVEDDPLVARVYAQHLSHSGMTIHVATNGEDGVAVASRVHPEVMVLDIHLPGISGIEVLRTMSTSADLSSIPIVVLSNDADPGLAADCWRLGALGYFVKSQTTPGQLLAQLHVWLGAAAAHVERDVTTRLARMA